MFRNGTFIGECRGLIANLSWKISHMGAVEVKLEHQVWRSHIRDSDSWMVAPSAYLIHPKGSST